MKALTFQAVNRLAYTDVADAELVAATDVVVQVTDCGVCGSELHIIEGRETGLDVGTVMGHELVGVVVDCGSAVRKVRIGDRVCCPFTTSCGRCCYCEGGLSCRCLEGQLFGWVSSGKGLQGSHAEFVRVPLADTTLMKLPDGLSADEGLLLGDNLSTGFYCADRAEISHDGTHVVLGCGTVGAFAVAAAKFLGANSVIAVDDISWRRENAMRNGATACCTVEESRDVIAAATNGRGADSVMEAVGTAAAALAFELVRPGGAISSVGVADDGKNLPFTSAAAYGKNLTYRAGRCPARAYMEWLGRLLSEKRFEVSSVVTHHLPLADGVAAYEMFATREPGIGKIVLQPTQRDA